MALDRIVGAVSGVKGRRILPRKWRRLVAVLDRLGVFVLEIDNGPHPYNFTLATSPADVFRFGRQKMDAPRIPGERLKIRYRRARLGRHEVAGPVCGTSPAG